MVATDLRIDQAPSSIIGGTTVSMKVSVHNSDPAVPVAVYQIRVFDNETLTLLINKEYIDGGQLITSMPCEWKQVSLEFFIPDILAGKRVLRIEAYYPARLPEIDAVILYPVQSPPVSLLKAGLIALAIFSSGAGVYYISRRGKR